MKCFSVVCVFAILFCARNSEGFKLLQKLKDVLHPTKPTTAQPILPSHNSDEDSSSNESNEHGGSSFKNTKNNRDFASKHKQQHHLDNVHNIKVRTTTYGYEGSNDNYPGQSSFSEDSYQNVRSTTNSYGSSDQNDLRTTTYKYEQNNYNDNYPSQSSSLDNNGNQNVKATTTIYGFGSQTERDQTSQSSYGGATLNQFLSETTTEFSSGYQDQNNGDSAFSSLEKPQSTTPRYGGSTESDGSIDSISSQNQNQDQLSGNEEENTNQDHEQSSYGQNVVPGVESSTSTSPEDVPHQGGYQSKKHSPSKKQPQDNGADGGAIIFPDNPSLNPTPEVERNFGNGDSSLDPRMKAFAKNAVGVPDDGGRHIIDGPTKVCGPGQTLDRKKNVCRALARK